MFRIAVDRSHDLLDVTMSGTLTLADVAAHATEVRQTILRERMHHFAILIDLTGCAVQTQEMVRAMAEHLAAMPKARVLAVVSASPLARLQLRRLFTQPYARVVVTREEGRAWVIEGQEPLAA